MSIKILIADDHPVTFLGIKETLKQYPDFEIVDCVTSGDRIPAVLDSSPIDILILDIDMPGFNGLDFLKKYRSSYKDLKIILYTVHEGEGYFREALKYQIQGYLLKTDPLETFHIILNRVMNGDFFYSSNLNRFILPANKPLSAKEKSILDYLMKGVSITEISKLLSISPRTVEYYTQKLKDRFEAENVVHLVSKVKDSYYK